jgi:hypothetical protein
MKISTLFRNRGVVTKIVQLRIFGLLAVAVAVIELILCFTGPISFIQRPSLMLFPPFATNLGAEQVAEVSTYIEKQIALTNSYSITSHSFIEEYFIRTHPEFDKSKLKPVDYQEAQKIAQELELERFAIAWIYSSSNHFEITVSIRDVKEGSILHSGRFVSESLEAMLQGIGKDGEPLDMRKDLAVQTKGIGFTDYLVLILLGLQLILGVLALIGCDPGFLVEIVWAPALILFVFAYIYALSANMDYVQRYIASSGQLQLAESTALEQFYALLRYGPILILNGLYYVCQTKNRAKRTDEQQNWVRKYITNWALPWVLLSAALFGFSFPSMIRLDGNLQWVYSTGSCSERCKP